MTPLRASASPLQAITCNVVNLFQAPHRTPTAKANGVFAQINIAARQMGVKDHMAAQYARQAKKDYLNGSRTADQVVADWKAVLRKIIQQVRA